MSWDDMKSERKEGEKVGRWEGEKVRGWKWEVERRGLGWSVEKRRCEGEMHRR